VAGGGVVASGVANRFGETSVIETVGAGELASELLVLGDAWFVADDEAPGLCESGGFAAFATLPDGAGWGLGLVRVTTAGGPTTLSGARTPWSKGATRWADSRQRSSSQSIPGR